MRRRTLLALGAAAPLATALAGCAAAATPGGTGDLGVVVERARGALAVVDTTSRSIRGEVEGLGDLSHASVVFSRDGASAFVFGRDGGLTRVNLLSRRIEARVMQAGNSIGGAISADGTLVAAQNYVPGGVKVFDARTLALVADIPAEYAPGKRSRVVGLTDLPGRRFAFSLFDGDAIWIADLADPASPRLTKLPGIGRSPYDALVTPDGRNYIAGLFGEDGLLLVDTQSWEEVDRIAVAGQPVFVIARPDARQVWVSFAVPDYDRVQVIDTPSRRIVRTLEPGRAVLHLEFTPRGEAVWVSARDDNRVAVIDTESFATLASLEVDSPSGIFFTARAGRIGF